MCEYKKIVCLISITYHSHTVCFCVCVCVHACVHGTCRKLCVFTQCVYTVCLQYLLLKEQVLSKCDGKASVDSGFGYIEPGHGVKGKQRWLMSDEDVVDMYTIHDGKKEILLWCYSQDSSKRPRSPDNADEGSTSQKRSRYNKQVDKMREVDEIEDDLRSKNEGKYSEEQIRMWAHLIQMNKHSSLEEPPNKKFWKTSGGTATSGAGGAGAAAGSGQGSSKGVLSSPGKRVNLRGQCIDQLHRLQQLYNDGGITEDQYLDMKESIMKEVKNLNELIYASYKTINSCIHVQQ